MADSKTQSSNVLKRQIFDKKSRYLQWYKVDNAGTMWSLVSRKKSPNIFRLSCTLTSEINVEDLQVALEKVIERFPYFRVNLRPGIFWYYWETNTGTPELVAESKYPSQFIPIYNKGQFPFRVRVYKKRIAIEFHHSLTDGTGGLAFLKALIGEYFHMRGFKVNDWQGIFRPEQTPHPNEELDSYKDNFYNYMPNPKLMPKAFQPPFSKEDVGTFNIVSGILSVKETLKVTREMKTTITELFTAIYLEALQEVLFNIPDKYRKRFLKPIRIPIPVNLRNIYPSKTMRNFTAVVNPELDPRLGKYSFKEIVKIVHHVMGCEICDKNVKQQISRNVRGEMHPVVKYMPLFVKKLFMKIIHNIFSETAYSGKISNVGRVTMPPEFSDEIERFDFILGASRQITTGCGVVSYKDNLLVTFGRTVKEATIEKFFFRKLVELGIQVKIETNY
ncbi:MAG: hypothetical protein ACTSO7_06390 [Candidatus Heimdallarchaeota archaeon]